MAEKPSITKLRNMIFVYTIACFSAIGGFLFGYDIGVISGILPMKHFREIFPSGPAKEGSIVASLLAGCFAGALVSGYLADKISRKYSMLVGSLIFIIGGILQATTNTFAQLYVGRVISGISVGIAVSFWIDYGCEKISSDSQWRIPLGIQVIPAAILAVSTIFLPFSPRWLLDHDRDEEGLKVIADLRSNGDKSDANVLSEYNEIKENVRFEREFAAKSYHELVKKGPENIRRRMILGVVIQVFQQFTGINAILYYAPQIFVNAGLADNSSRLLATGINGVVNMLCTIPAIIWVDKWGRRPTFISGGFLMGCAMLIIGIILGATGIEYYDPELEKNFMRLDKTKNKSLEEMDELFGKIDKKTTKDLESAGGDKRETSADIVIDSDATTNT
ncbi:9336_t:CDS:10 [Entrophospora sp. SA101]|nr:9336_t:CDS:10 [Entrophospora sp. SA101]CAJ0837284.1 16320_t:CDS:10 [Entrophospora sp. SA101]